MSQNILISMCLLCRTLIYQSVLGLIYEAEKNLTKACDCYFIEAEIVKHDPSKWENVYELSVKLNLHKRQLYCLSRIIHLEPNNPTYLEKRYLFLLEDKQQNRATTDLLAYCHLTHDMDRYSSQLYSLCTQNHRQPELLAYYEEIYPSMIKQLSLRLSGDHNQKFDMKNTLESTHRIRTIIFPH